jgi:hypothetical protein
MNILLLPSLIIMWFGFIVDLGQPVNYTSVLQVFVSTTNMNLGLGVDTPARASAGIPPFFRCYA